MSGFLVCNPNTKVSIFSLIFAEEVGRVMVVEDCELASKHGLPSHSGLPGSAKKGRQGRERQVRSSLTHTPLRLLEVLWSKQNIHSGIFRKFILQWSVLVLRLINIYSKTECSGKVKNMTAGKCHNEYGRQSKRVWQKYTWWGTQMLENFSFRW